ncbi:hypothetical protein [Heyndrickxia sporothermodurans]|uniref:hypothetical protein n=1 Tax=Heyndrickxia sporothermodurans TaxID=46224 RepID=UPI0035DF2CD0
MLKENDIINYLKEHDLYDPTGQDKIVCGVIMPSTLDYVLYGAGSVLSTKFNVLNYSDKGLVIIPIDNLTGKIVQNAHVFIPKDQITNIELKSKLASYKVKFDTVNGSTSFKVNKLMIGAGWHKKNLQSFLSSIG